MDNSITTLIKFVDSAERSRKYPASTAQGLRVALRLFEGEINQEEKDSIEVLKNNLDRINQDVYRKNSDNFTVSSLTTYKSRILRIISDYEKYGIDPTKMVNWQPKVVSRKKKTKQVNLDSNNNASSEHEKASEREDIHKIELALRPGKKIAASLPYDSTNAEIDTLISILESLKAKDKGSANEKDRQDVIK